MKDVIVDFETVSQGALCSFCGEHKDCVIIETGEEVYNFTVWICESCAREIVKLHKTHRSFLKTDMQEKEDEK